MDFSFGFSIETLAEIAIATTFVIGVLKNRFPEKVKGKALLMGLALGLPMIFAVVSKLIGNFGDYNWFATIIFGLGTGLASSQVHDKLNPVLKPIVEKLLGILKKKGGDPVKEAITAAAKADDKDKPKPIVLDENNQIKK